MAEHVVIGELLAACVRAVRFVGKCQAADHFILGLDVAKLVFSYVRSESLTTCEVGARITPESRSLKRACG